MKEKNAIRSIMKLSMTNDELIAYTRLFKLIVKNKEREPYQLLYRTISEDTILKLIFNVALELATQPLSLIDNMLSSEQVCKALDVSVRTLAQWRKDGIMPCTIWKGKAYYNITHINKTIEAGLQTPSRNLDKRNMNHAKRGGKRVQSKQSKTSK